MLFQSEFLHSYLLNISLIREFSHNYLLNMSLIREFRSNYFLGMPLIREFLYDYFLGMLLIRKFLHDNTNFKSKIKPFILQQIIDKSAALSSKQFSCMHLLKSQPSFFGYGIVTCKSIYFVCY